MVFHPIKDVSLDDNKSVHPEENPGFKIQLSKRELEVLKLLVDGRSNVEIAKVLYLSPNTVKTHVRSILNKLGVDHRIQAAVMALRHNLI